MDRRVDIQAMTPVERLALIEELWDSLSGHRHAVPLTPAQIEELDRRLDEMAHDEDADVPIDEAFRRFPYFVLHRVRQEPVVVVAVMHAPESELLARPRPTPQPVFTPPEK
jgi:putative addiction module component (TIGR02574 family)